MRLRLLLALAVGSLPLAAYPSHGQTVGVTTAVNQSATGTAPRAAIRTITIGEKIFHNEKIETNASGLLQVLLADGTTFTVGPDSRLTIDSFVYDPKKGTAEITASLGKGLFRFIGGRTSKTPDGVRLNTPVGTVGIRGAIADLFFSRQPDIPSHIDLLYGEQIVLTGRGQPTTRLYTTGYSIVIGSNGRPHVQRTLQAWLTSFENLIRGQSGQHGGAPLQPTDMMVVASDIHRSNSDLGPLLGAIPIPTPRPQSPDQAVLQEANKDMKRSELPSQNNGNTGGGNTGGGDTGNGNTGGGNTGGGQPQYSTVPLRVLLSSASTPGEGIIGGSADTDQTTALKVASGSSEGAGTLVQGSISLPVFNDATFTAHAVSGVSSPFGPLSGTVYGGPDGFAAYLLTYGTDPISPFYAITGTPTDVASVFSGTGVVHYALTPDPLQGIAVPFMMNNPDFDFSSASNSDLLVAESATPADNSVRAMQTWLAITGTGTDQKSAIGVNVGALGGDGNFLMDRRGSYRGASDGVSSELFGSAASLAGPSGQSVFGGNGQNFVLSAGLSPGGAFYDAAADGFASGAPFSTVHVANRGSSDPDVARTLSGAYDGFAAGALEGAVKFGGEVDSIGSFVPNTLLYSNFGDVKFSFDPQSRSLGGSIQVWSANSYSEENVALAVGFGNGMGSNSQNGQSAYINDNAFAATANPNPSATSVNIPDIASGTEAAGQQPGTYVVSSGSISGLSNMAFMQNVDSSHLCSDCDFMKWGWWGTQAQISSTSPSSGNQARLAVHLGTWVIGDVTNVSQLVPLASTAATYAGLAVGNVTNVTSDETKASYIAAGKMDMTYNFGLRQGSFSVSNFDGHDFAGTMAGVTSGSQATFGGALSNDASSVTGHANGAFVNNGADMAAGVIGDFNAQETSGNWAASGVFLGSRTGSRTVPTGSGTIPTY